LNYPINTPKDDFSYVLNDDNKTGFISSNRFGIDMINEFSKNDPTFMLFGIAKYKGTIIPVEGVQVEIYDEMLKKNIEMTSDKQGKFKLKLNPETKYSLSCSRLGCYTRKDRISTVGKKFSENFYADFEVEEIVIEKPIILKNIYYDLDKWFIRTDAALELDKLAKLLNDNPNIEIELGSHTDSRASDNYNLILSHKRAKAAIEYLVSKGIAQKRMTYKGYGEKVLVNRCKNDVICSEEEHQENRRTEFKVTKK
jgi:outer membrane protein OmpA-like peptidoglycan-associated protein